MPVIIKEIHVRTVVEKRIITETEVSDEIVRKIENRVLDKLSVESIRSESYELRHWRKKRER
ncbi:hypothetical protein [Parabacteroides gordonii]|jgi:hypothetical protein|uniref:Uncharacterized protein n=1 Tax=Parabacteroides gordonii MS-1 = DSM 23371 TaxID=1203610 RepID=A0A0F5IYR8_9BACT|nr:hypothetical protein [Parabacteroides gordonii]KKB50613.1 hypothetical protein HMPREF1536_04152 [Parabacteroides gordonii MS-1 = DSM 23371]MCA5585369.1 hypothetical protein [Parabacteroides gordonii]RGP16386.1 hypothetical protein DXB27_12845 [Parabacteroides gordonii]